MEQQRISEEEKPSEEMFEISHGIQRSETQDRVRSDIGERNRYQENCSRSSYERKPYSINIPDDSIDKPERNIQPIDKDIEEISYGKQRSETQDRVRSDIDERNRYQENCSRSSKSEPERKSYYMNIPDEEQPERNLRPMDKDIQEKSYGIQRSETQDRVQSDIDERNRYQENSSYSSPERRPYYTNIPDDSFEEQPERNIRPMNKEIQEKSYGIQRSETQDRVRSDIEERNRYQEISSMSSPERRPYTTNVSDDPSDQQPERNIRPMDKDIEEISYGMQRSEMQERERGDNNDDVKRYQMK